MFYFIGEGIYFVVDGIIEFDVFEVVFWVVVGLFCFCDEGDVLMCGMVFVEVELVWKYFYVVVNCYDIVLWVVVEDVNCF